MTAFETAITKTPYTNPETPEQFLNEQDDLARLSFRDRLLSTHTGRVFTSFVTTLGLGIVGEAVISSPADAVGQQPMKPGQIESQIEFYYENTMNGNYGLIRLSTERLSAHSWKETGFCQKNDPNDTFAFSQEYSLQNGVIQIACQRGSNNKRLSVYRSLSSLRASSFVPPAVKSMNWGPELDQAGNDAVESVGLTATQHGAPKSIYVTRQPDKHTAEADVYYIKGTGTGRQLKELKLRVVDGHETVEKVWY